MNTSAPKISGGQPPNPVADLHSLWASGWPFPETSELLASALGVVWEADKLGDQAIFDAVWDTVEHSLRDPSATADTVWQAGWSVYCEMQGPAPAGTVRRSGSAL